MLSSYIKPEDPAYLNNALSVVAWDAGYAYDEITHEFVDASHNHYNNYYKIVNRTSFEPVKSDEEFAQNLYYKAPEKHFTEDKYYLFTN